MILSDPVFKKNQKKSFLGKAEDLKLFIGFLEMSGKIFCLAYETSTGQKVTVLYSTLEHSYSYEESTASGNTTHT